MSEFITSDTHFGHFHIIEYCKRPFKSTKEMDDTIIKRWNKMVSPSDTIYHLGDFSLTPAYRTEVLLQILHGYKILVRGNHDRSRKRMLELGFDEVYDKLLIKDYHILIHVPIFIEGKITYNVGVDQHNFSPIPFPKGDSMILCGHMHEKWKTKTYEDIINERSKSGLV